MLNRQKPSQAGALICALGVVLWPVSLGAILSSDKLALPNYDKREGSRVQIPAERSLALEQLRAAVRDAILEFDPLTASPKWVRSGNGFLTGPTGAGPAISPEALARWQQADPHRILKAFLDSHSALFGEGAEILNGARLTRQFVTPHSGLKTSVWEQQLDDIAVFEGFLIAHLTRNGELVSVCSGFVPELKRAADSGTPNRAVLQISPTISATRAVVLAASEVGEHSDERDVNAVEPVHEQFSLHRHFRASALKGFADTRLVWLPMDGTHLRLCWAVILTSRSRGEMFRVLIDVRTGEALVRHCLTSYISDATYRVYPSDSPTPLSPGYSTPSASQPPVVARTLLSFSAVDTNASPNGWIEDGVNETRGNNVDAHTDWNDDDQPDLPRPQGFPFRVFDFPIDLSTQDPTNFAPAAVTQLFYWCNWMHDKLYGLGFTEAAGNFQNNNFGRGGADNDAIQADAQDGGGVNNANFSVEYDGNPARMQMYNFSSPSPRRDGDLDAEIVLHEYTHGLSNRRVGGGVLITALQTAGMGEGWSDFYALALLSQAGDDVNGVYTEAAYASYLLSGLTQNYYYGIRRYPYCTDTNKNPLTFKDIDPAQASSHAGVPKSPRGGGAASEVHNQGEVWCVTLWDARGMLINKYGWATGNQLILQLVTDGMNLSPANPNFLEARDAILQADIVDSGGANLGELWAAFAKRGMGFSATSPASSTTTGVHEAFDLPFDSLMILPVSGFDASGPLGGPFAPGGQTYTLINTGTNALSWASGVTAPWLTVSPSGGTLALKNSSVTVTTLVAAAANSLFKGNYSGAAWFTNLSTGVAFSRAASLGVGKSLIAWGANGDGQTVQPENLFDVVAISCGSYNTLALTRAGTVVGWGGNFLGQNNVPVGLSGVVGIAAGPLHSMALKSDGTVAVWGSDIQRQLEMPADLTNAVAIAAGSYHSLALLADSTLVGWGSGKFVAYPEDGYNYGQLIIPAGLSNVVALAAGAMHSVALKSDGTVVCWGGNDYGQANVPIGLNNVAAVAAGAYHTMALKKDGAVVVWGDSATRSPPAGLASVVAIAAGEEHDLALLANGTVVAWGEDLYGETEIPNGLTNVVGIGSGWYHSVALLNDGTLSLPWVYKQPASRAVPKNGSVIFNVGAVGTPVLAYHWRKDGVALANGGNIAGADSPALSLSGIAASDAGSYSVVISNQVGSVLSSNALLTLLDPAILQEPSSSTNVLGTTATFSVVTTGTTPIRYQWQKNGTDLSDGGNISGSSTANLSLSAVQPTDAANYTVVVSNHKGSVTSSSATLTVIATPEITRQPLSRVQLAGKNVSFSVNVRGAVPLRYRWLKNGTNYLNDGGKVSGAETATLNLADLNYLDAGNYSVIVTNSSGSVSSTTARLTVNTFRGHIVAWGDNQYGESTPPPGLSNVVAVDAGGYHNLALNADGTLVEWGDTNFIPAGISNVTAFDISQGLDLIVKADGTVGAWGWNFYGETLVPPGLSNVIAVAAGYNFASALKGDGTALVWGSDPFHMNDSLAQMPGITAISAGDEHLTVLKGDGTIATLGDGFAGQTNVPSGLSNVLAIAAGGRHTLALKTDGTVTGWGANYYGQINVPAGLTNVIAIAAGLGSSMAIKADGSLVAWGGFDRGASDAPPVGLTNVAAAASAYVHSMALVNDFLPPTVTSPPLSRTDNAGTSVAFTVSAAGGVPITYQWRKNGLNLVDGGKLSGTHASTLTIANVLKVDEGHFSVAITNGAGFAVSSEAQLIIIDPVVLIPPASRTNLTGTAATFSISANGTPPLNYQWLKNGIVLSDSGKISGANTPTLSLVAVDQSDSGNYSVTITNSVGSAISAPPAILTVIAPPAVTTQPADRANNLGTTATFSVAATGSSLHYQWQKDSSDLADGIRVSGANSATLTLSDVVKNDAGPYRVVITNLVGSITSSNAVLTVLDPLFVFTHPATSIAATRATINGMIAPEGASTAAWFEWGTNAGYSHQTVVQDVGSSRGVVHISAALAGLNQGATIHFRLVASNATRSVYGIDQQFVTGGRPWAWGDNSSGQAQIPADLGKVVALAGGLNHSLALRTDGIPKGWGNNTYGQNSMPSRATNVAAIAAGGFHNLALLTNGAALAWGRNNVGQANIPVGLGNVVALAAGGSHSLALRSDGSVAAWGDNSQGQIGIPAGLSNVVGVAAGWYHSLALRSDGTVAAWGNNTYGQRNVPTNLTNVVWIGAGLYHCLALRTDGTMVAWGYNGTGQTTVPASLNNVVAAASGGSHNLALSPDGSLTGWGYNLYSQTTIPAGLSNIVSIAAGGTHSLAMTTTSNSPPTLAQQSVFGYVNQDIVEALQGTDADGDALTYAVGSLPARGALFQYAAGARGQPILLPGTIVTDTSGRIIFAPVADEFASPYTTARFTVNDGLVDSPVATLTFNVILPPPPQLDSAASSWTNGAFQLVFSGAANASYSVWESTNLVNWNLLGPAQTITQGRFRFVDITTTNWPQRFYRAGAP